MTANVTVTFEPDGKKITDLPRSVLEIAREAGIGLRSECGGTGTCGKCRVQIVKKYGSVSLPTDKEQEHLSGAELTQGYRLACQARILSGTATVFIPKESRNEAREISGTALEGNVAPAPAIKKVHCVLLKPSLEDTRPDLERLAEGLGPGEIPDIPLSVLAVLPDTLRAADWDVTAVFWNDALIAVEAGDTVKERYGVAIDIGSSKIICHLVDLNDGRTIAQEHAENPQIMYGEDVVSRITYAAKAPENLRRLQSLSLIR